MSRTSDRQDSAASLIAFEAADLAASRQNLARRTGRRRSAARRSRLPVRVGLARDPVRIIAWLGIRLVIAEVGLVVGLQSPGTIGLAVTLAGMAVLVYVIILAAHVLSVRLEILPGAVRVASLIVRRRYSLRDGPVTRLRVEPRKGIFGTQLGGFGIEIGFGQGPADESIDVVRLSPIASVIVIPAFPNRLAVVPASERTLFRALELGAEGSGLDTHRIGGHDAPSRASR